MGNFRLKLGDLYDKGWFVFFHLAELISRLGVLKMIPDWSKQVEVLEEMLVRDCELSLKRYYEISSDKKINKSY
jgi:hypothetical protein